jgi:hypothetical protein
MKEKSSTTILSGSTPDTQGEKVAVFNFYVLIDPRDNQIKYVGRTVDPNNRLRNHIYEAKKKNRSKKERWIISLLRRNMSPILKVVYVLNCSLEEAILTEKNLVKKLTKKGHVLKNSPDNYLGAVLTGKKVYQFSLTGEFIKEHYNSNQARLFTNIHDSAILQACKKFTKSAGGFLWSFDKNEKFISYDVNWRYKKVKPIVCICPNGNIKEYSSSREASKELNIHWKRISSVLTGRNKTANGYKFKFKN